MAWRRRNIGRRRLRRSYGRRRLTGGVVGPSVNPYSMPLIGLRRRGRPGLRRKRPLAAVSGGKRRRFVGAPTMRKRKKNNPVGDLGYQMQVQKYRLGRNLSTQRMLKVLDRRTHNYIIGRFSGVNRCTDNVGYSRLALLGDSSVPANLCEFPLHLFELTVKPQVNANGSAIVSTMSAGACLHVFNQAFNDVVNNYSWLSRAGITTGAVSDGRPELLFTNTLSQLSSNAINFGEAYLEWAKVKFCFRTPTARAGRVTVELVEMLEDEASPQITPAANRRQEICNSWQHELTGYLYNPIKTDVYNQKTGAPVFRVLKRWTKSFQPALTIEGDPNANHIRMEFFLRLNKYVNFNETSPTGDGGNVTVAEVTGAEPMAIAADQDNRSGYPLRAKYRRFLVVKGTNYDDVALTVDPTKHITYDFDIQTKWVFRPGQLCT